MITLGTVSARIDCIVAITRSSFRKPIVWLSTGQFVVANEITYEEAVNLWKESLCKE